MKFVLDYVPSIKKSDSILSETTLEVLAKILCTDIICYNNFNNLLEFEPGQQVFPKPIVLEVKDDSIYLLYTRNQAYCYANLADKKIFMKKAEKGRDGERSVEESKIDRTKFNQCKNAINTLADLFDDLLSRLCKFFKAINVSSENRNMDTVRSALRTLMNANFVYSDIKDDTALQGFIPDFIAKLDDYIPYFTYEAILTEAFDKLSHISSGVVDPYEFGGSKARTCINCNNHCQPYKAYRLVCGHMHCEECFEKYCVLITVRFLALKSLRSVLDLSALKCKTCAPPAEGETCICGATENLIINRNFGCVICQNCIVK